MNKKIDWENEMLKTIHDWVERLIGFGDLNLSERLKLGGFRRWECRQAVDLMNQAIRETAEGLRMEEKENIFRKGECSSCFGTTGTCGCSDYNDAVDLNNSNVDAVIYESSTNNKRMEKTT